MRRMKLRRKKRNLWIYPLFITLLIIVTSCDFKIKSADNSNTEFINKLLYYSNFNNENNLEIPNIINKLNDIVISEPVSIINKVFAYEKEIENIQDFSYIQNIVIDNPRVYIYSTHTTESYSDGKDIVLLSKVLQEKLNSLGITTIVEERSSKDYIEDNNLEYKYSYLATRKFLEDKLKQHDFDLIIDLHRDAVSRNATTKTINGKTYARPMFVMNVDYENIKLAKKINDIIENKYPGLSRGIYNKYYDNFNQDLNSNVVLIEVGGNYNTFEEATNTADVLSEAIKELLK